MCVCIYIYIHIPPAVLRQLRPRGHEAGAGRLAESRCCSYFTEGSDYNFSNYMFKKT